MAHSSAARAAVEGYTRALAREWADDGIAVLALAAGHFDTESLRKYPEPVWRGAARTVPLQRLGREQEHAWLVALAASDLGRALSGRSSRSTAAATTGSAPGRRRRWSTTAARSPPRRAATRALTAIIGAPRGRGVRAACEPSKLSVRVRFPSPAL